MMVMVDDVYGNSVDVEDNNRVGRQDCKYYGEQCSPSSNQVETNP